MRALVWFGLDGAASLYSHDDGAGLVFDDDGAVGPAQEAAVVPRKKPPSPPPKSETDAKANEKVTLCNNFAQLSLQSQQRCAQTRTSSPERQ